MKIIQLLSILLISTFVNAECIENNCSGITVERIYMYPESSTLRIGTSGDESKLDCNASQGKYISLDLSKTYAKEAYALILAAHQSQNTFWIQTSGANTDCYVNYLVSDK